MDYPKYVKIGEKKYKINTDFRVAIECNNIIQDKNIGDTERGLAIIYKLFGEKVVYKVCIWVAFFGSRAQFVQPNFNAFNGVLVQFYH